MRWIFLLQQRLAITTHECLALGLAVALLAGGLLVREFAPAAQPFPGAYLEEDAAFAAHAARAASPLVASGRADPGGAVPAAAHASAAAGEPAAMRRVDVNRADEATLATLPRIGPALARRIVDERERHGPFGSLADLQRVRGIGVKTVAELAPMACVACTDADEHARARP